MPRWLIYALLTVLLWGGWGFASRKLGAALSAEQTLAISTLGMLPILLWLGAAGARPVGRSARSIWIAIAAGVLTGMGNLGIYELLRGGEKAATLVPLTALYPLVTVVLSVICLRERLNAWQTAGILLSLAAIYSFNVARESHLSSPGFGLVLLPLVLWGLSALLQKVATRGLTAEVSCFWFLLGMVPVAAAVAISSPMPHQLPLLVLLWALGVGFLLGMGNLTLLSAYAADGKASIITPLSGLYPAVTVSLAILFLGERILPREWAGIILSLLGIAAMSFDTDASAPTPVEART